MPMKALMTVPLMFVTVAVAACNPVGSSDSIPASPEDSQEEPSLRPISDCGELLDRLKTRAIVEMEERLEENLDYTLGWEECHGSLYFSPTGERTNAGTDSYSAGGADSGAPPDGGPGSSDGASLYSGTNTQEVGVDEADFVKNDGVHIYILADDAFKIVEAWPPDGARIIASLDVEGTPRKMFVAQDRALVYSSLEQVGSHDQGRSRPGDCIYAYDCDFAGDGRRLKITLLDISDRSRPTLLRETWLGGAYLNSRMIGTVTHTAVMFPPTSYPELSYWPEVLGGYWSCNTVVPHWEILAAFDTLKRKNRKIILESDITQWLPAMRDARYVDGSVHVEEEGVVTSCRDYYESGLPQGQSFLSLLSMDITDLDPLSATTIVGKPGAVYASSGTLYVSSRNHSAGDPDGSSVESSTVHKFRLEDQPPGCSYVGSGFVKGRVLSQFSMDEHDGYLRIATTTGHVPDPDVHSTLSVLEEREGRLVVAGAVDRIAPGEDIRSVRFDGDRAFVVTFKKTDPLFAIDLTDPMQPRIEGELKVPGYSTYMHLMDESHLITIGYDADDRDDFAWFSGIMLQIFDISDMSLPCLLHKEVIGTRGSTSDAATDHLAFNYFAPKDLLAIPITICEGGSGGSYGNEVTFSGLLVYDLTEADGFTQRGGVPHVDPETADANLLCTNWWTRSNSIVKRSIFMDDYVFSVATDLIKVQHLDRLGEDVASIALVSP